MPQDSWTDVRVAVTGDTILIDGADIGLEPGFDAHSTIIRHIARTTSVPQQRQVWVTIRDGDGVTQLVVGPHGRAWMVTPAGSP